MITNIIIINLIIASRNCNIFLFLVFLKFKECLFCSEILIIWKLECCTEAVKSVEGRG